MKSLFIIFTGGTIQRGNGEPPLHGIIVTAPVIQRRSASFTRKGIAMHQNCMRELLLSLFAGLMLTVVPASFAAPNGPETLVGKAAPDFTLKDTSGKTVSFSQFKGKPVLIEFWATWCPYCLEVLPGVQKIYKEYSSKGVEVVAVSVDTKQEKVVPFLEKNAYTMPVLLDDGNMLKRFNTRIIPTVFLIDRTGVVRMYWTNYGKKGQNLIESELDKMIEK